VIEHRHVIFVLAVVKVAKRDVTAVRSLTEQYTEITGLNQNVKQTLSIGNLRQ